MSQFCLKKELIKHFNQKQFFSAIVSGISINRMVVNNILLKKCSTKMQHLFKKKQDYGADQCDKALFNMKYVTAGTFNAMN